MDPEKPKQNIEADVEAQKHNYKVERALEATGVQKEAYDKLIDKIDSRFGDKEIYAGNLLKSYIKKEILASGKNNFPKLYPELERNTERFIKMCDQIGIHLNDDAFAKSLGIRTGTQAGRLAEQARDKGVTSPEQMAIVKLYALTKGLQSTELISAYESYIKALYLPDILDKFDEIL